MSKSKYYVQTKLSGRFPRVVYGNAVNLAGLYSAVPLKCTYRKDLKVWFDKEGNFDVEKLGLVRQLGCITFASVRRKDVELWTSGVREAMLILRRWSQFKE